ncbi:uncharacterized protein [Triticum aestivum]|uniref:uncharacterized protein n=1 Tax=Triticum aestivum TaxID=4565 RepID=UPI001D016B5D|nr:uncharacterized protein LOC123142818 [Triticum aestivum]
MATPVEKKTSAIAGDRICNAVSFPTPHHPLSIDASRLFVYGPLYNGWRIDACLRRVCRQQTACRGPANCLPSLSSEPLPFPDPKVDRLGSFRGLLGFAATCPSWQAAYLAYPSKSIFCTKFPPLLIQPHERALGPPLPSTDSCHELVTCKVIDPANPNTALRCRIPQETVEMKFIGSSYGNLIYYCDGCCRIVDVFTGVEVSTPRLPSSAGYFKFFLKGILTAPLASPNSHLLVSTRSSLLDLPVGSDSWSEVQLRRTFEIDEIVKFNCQFIVSNGHASFYTVQLVPRLGLHLMTTKFHDTIKLVRKEGRAVFGRLLVCGDMFLMGDGARSFYRLDMSTKPATWMTVENLNNWALFTGGGPTPSCMSPELWGGKSNARYFADIFQPWSLYGLCGEPDPVQDTRPINVDILIPDVAPSA